ncbi:EF-hand domain-containing protein [Pseudomonas fakonensis]|uniref:EF-hand domain-containing protein n=1 Tax=Pseudomonas fakonensis TaxID=2842355 RepID=A0ABX8N259_9PSED|nr:EF-hand domain-containing protein [Pseudomonas fakonensis]QXH50394.1 EF-hand domain-containing protein [Pseudomonas fakonensis]
MDNECKIRLYFAKEDFRKADTNEDGTVTLDELQQILLQQNLISTADIAHYFADIDLNKDARISWREFLIEYLEIEPEQLESACPGTSLPAEN